MSRTSIIERKIVVFSSWTLFGLIGLGFLLEGGVRGNYLIGCIGTIAIAAGFVCHVIANSIFAQTFSKGEIALGLGLFVIFTIVFILSWLTGGLSPVSFLIGLTTFLVLIVGFLTYLLTRYGVGGAFRKFDVSSYYLSRDKE